MKTKKNEMLTDQDVLAMPEADYMNPVQLEFFRKKLQDMEKELLSNAGETTEHLRETVIVPDPADRSVSVTTVLLPAGTDVDALRQVAREQFQVAFAGALGPLAGRAFRIGHLGDQNPASMLGCLAGVEGALLAQGIPIGRDGLARAVAVFQNAGG